MELRLARHLWGVDESWETVFPRIKADGFSGIECPLPAPQERARFRAQLDAHGFFYIAMIFTGGANVDDHLASFREQLASAKTLNPILVNAHSGSDAWNLDDSRRFYAEALRSEGDSGLQVAHETHRGRVMYNPWITRDLLNAFPELAITCDYSHWVCVAERLIDSESAILQLCAERALHIHARVGYEEGPQVPDPRAPEFQRHVAAHERWWDLVWNAQQARGLKMTTLTPEFGPPGYLHTLPYTGAPVANLWDICSWQGKRQAERFAKGGWSASVATTSAKR